MSPRQLTEKWRSENPGHDHGYVIVYRGEVAGWTSDLSNTAQNGRLAWIAGCMAVPSFRNSPMFMAAGGDDQSGAECWERMDPKYEPSEAERPSSLTWTQQSATFRRAR